eukprot:m51a1_g9438 putative ras-related protein rab-11a (232) ;mRNA; f:442971-443848
MEAQQLVPRTDQEGGPAPAAAIDCLYKLVLIGDSGVGKSNLLARFSLNEFLPDSKATVGVEFAMQTVTCPDGAVVKAQVWDTAGQERFRAISNLYYRGAHGALVVYSIASRDSFDNVRHWVEELLQHAPAALVILVGNKCDLKHLREVPADEGRQYAERNGFAFIETSARDATNVSAAFLEIISAVRSPHARPQVQQTTEDDGPRPDTPVDITPPPAEDVRPPGPPCPCST